MKSNKLCFWVNFNDRLADDLIVLSEYDIMTDLNHTDWYLDEGAPISVYSRETLPGSDHGVTLVADGVIVRNHTDQRPEVMFCCKIDARGIHTLTDLDKPRMLVDFNEMLADDLVLLSRDDSKYDSAFKEIRLQENLPVGIFSEDNLDNDGCVNPIIADGVAVLNTTGLFPHVKWCCKIDADGIRYLTDERKFIVLTVMAQNVTPANYAALLAESRNLLMWLRDNNWTAEGVYERLLPVHNTLNGLQRNFMATLLDEISNWR